MTLDSLQVAHKLQQIETLLRKLQTVERGGGGILSTSVTRSTNRAIASSVGTWTPIAFDVQRWDDLNCHDTVTNNTRLTAQEGGKYLVTAQVMWTNNANGQRRIRIRLNSATTIAAERKDALSITNLYSSNQAVTVYELNKNDYIELHVHQNSGNTLNALYLANYSVIFGMAKLS